MTRRDYHTIAACIGHSLKWATNPNNRSISLEAAVQDLADRLILEMELDNPRFNRECFATAIDKEFASASGY